MSERELTLATRLFALPADSPTARPRRKAAQTSKAAAAADSDDEFGTSLAFRLSLSTCSVRPRDGINEKLRYCIEPERR